MTHFNLLLVKNSYSDQYIPKYVKSTSYCFSVFLKTLFWSCSELLRVNNFMWGYQRETNYFHIEITTSSHSPKSLVVFMKPEIFILCLLTIFTTCLTSSVFDVESSLNHLSMFVCLALKRLCLSFTCAQNILPP